MAVPLSTGKRLARSIASGGGPWRAVAGPRRQRATARQWAAGQPGSGGCAAVGGQGARIWLLLDGGRQGSPDPAPARRQAVGEPRSGGCAVAGDQGARIRWRREDAAATTDGLSGPVMGSLGFFLFFD